MRFCQLEKIFNTLFILILCVACSHQKAAAPTPQAKLWFNIPSTYAFENLEGQASLHPFFDLLPNWRGQQQLINYILVSPAESSYQYDFDLLSGRLYKVRNNCVSEDVTGEFENIIDKPNFSLGVIPQIYNQQRNAQKIIIFKEFSENEKFLFAPEKTYETRVIGSVILEYCDKIICDAKELSKVTQILVGVDPHNPKYAAVKSLPELKSLINWPYTKAYIENQYGVHHRWKKAYPAYKVNSELGFVPTVKYFLNNSVAVNMKQLIDWRQVCFGLYDSMWSQIKKIRSEPNGQQEKFYEMMKSFYTRDLEQFTSCQKLVRPANINEDSARHWFFTFMSAAVNLEKNRFYFSCSKNKWIYNSPLEQKPLTSGELQELGRCRASSLEKMFNQAVEAMSTMYFDVNKFYRYIEYDTEHGGSHQKIFSWVLEHDKKLACDKVDASPEIFPKDIQWQPLKPNENKALDIKIIR
jgi:hypothetical protein